MSVSSALVEAQDGSMTIGATARKGYGNVESHRERDNLRVDVGVT
jgi:hypothetical protein